MASTAAQLARLANDQQFRDRIQTLVGQIAGEIYGEAANTAHHAERLAYARQVTLNPQFHAQIAAAFLVTRPNLSIQDTTFNFTSGFLETSATDDEIRSQIATDWNLLAGVVA